MILLLLSDQVFTCAVLHFRIHIIPYIDDKITATATRSTTNTRWMRARAVSMLASERTYRLLFNRIVSYKRKFLSHSPCTILITPLFDHCWCLFVSIVTLFLGNQISWCRCFSIVYCVDVLAHNFNQIFQSNWMCVRTNVHLNCLFERLNIV